MSVDTEHYMMGDKEAKRSPFSLLNGNYKVRGNWYSSIVVNGSKCVMKKAGNPIDFDIKVGGIRGS